MSRRDSIARCVAEASRHNSVFRNRALLRAPIITNAFLSTSIDLDRDAMAEIHGGRMKIIGQHANGAITSRASVANRSNSATRR
jgi:hypothetical protein